MLYHDVIRYNDRISLLKKSINVIVFKEYLKFVNRLYDITWFGAVYA